MRRGPRGVRTSRDSNSRTLAVRFHFDTLASFFARRPKIAARLFRVFARASSSRLREWRLRVAADRARNAAAARTTPRARPRSPAPRSRRFERRTERERESPPRRRFVSSRVSRTITSRRSRASRVWFGVRPDRGCPRSPRATRRRRSGWFSRVPFASGTDPSPRTGRRLRRRSVRPRVRRTGPTPMERDGDGGGRPRRRAGRGRRRATRRPSTGRGGRRDTRGGARADGRRRWRARTKTGTRTGTRTKTRTGTVGSPLRWISRVRTTPSSVSSPNTQIRRLALADALEHHSASIGSSAESVVASLREAFDARDGHRDDERSSNLAGIDASLASLTDDDVRRFARRCAALEVPAGRQIVRPGRRREFFGILAKGLATVVSAEGAIVAELAPGAWIGETGYVTGDDPSKPWGTRRDAAVVSAVDGTVVIAPIFAAAQGRWNDVIPPSRSKSRVVRAKRVRARDGKQRQARPSRDVRRGE